jgi:hypothetical protein
MAPAKNFAHPPFFSSKALQNGSHNIKNKKYKTAKTRFKKK